MPAAQQLLFLQEHRRLHVQERHARDAGVNGILMIDAGQGCVQEFCWLVLELGVWRAPTGRLQRSHDER